MFKLIRAPAPPAVASALVAVCTLVSAPTCVRSAEDPGADPSADAGVGDADASGEDTETCAVATSCPIFETVTLEDPPCRACDTCIATRCCAEMTECFASSNEGPSDCELLFTCIIGIGPDTCASTGACAACERAHPDSVEKYRALASCIALEPDTGDGACKRVCRNL
ncbi:hypothetical protein WMF20_46195 [Sorangium sp. So ce834]|uniref:hypothetical protein n=1 Tax=Sorangium sp. So ce834 TaxID=3133321 RepID=UPI003F6409EE